MRPKRVCKYFEIKNLGQYHDFYVQSNTLVLADVCQNFQDMFLEIHELDPPIPAPGLAGQSVFKMTKVKLGFLADIKVLIMVEKSIRRGTYHSNLSICKI